MTVVFVSMPSNPDEITAPMDLVNGFRIAGIATMTMFWFCFRDNIWNYVE